jgi:hypothetical protein
MSVYFLRFFLFAVMALSAVTTQAGWFCDFLDSFPRDTKRRNCWPKPFECQDRQFARTPFALQVIKGWQRQNTIGSQYFDVADGQLNEAGKLKIRWILLEEPAQYRSIYIYAGQSIEETDRRLKSVQAYASQVVPKSDLPMISTTTISDEGWPADRVDMIGRKYQATMPAPRLPAISNQGGSSSSAGGSGT